MFVKCLRDGFMMGWKTHLGITQPLVGKQLALCNPELNKVCMENAFVNPNQEVDRVYLKYLVYYYSFIFFMIFCGTVGVLEWV